MTGGTLAAMSRRRAPATDVHLPANALLVFWRSYLRISFALQAALCLAITGYLLLTPHGEHRFALLTLLLVAVGQAVGGWCTSPWLATRAWRSGFWLARTMVACVIMAFATHLDGGLGSPLLFLPVLPVMSVMLALPPRAVALCGGTALAAFISVGLATPPTARHDEKLLMLSVIMFTTVVLAVASAVHIARHRAQDTDLLVELSRRADTDGLTGCMNHRAFHELLGVEVERARRYSRPLSVMMCDADHLKTFNDTFGHPAGDTALAAVGSTLRSMARSGDIAARVGGDEFAILLPETTAAQAVGVADRIMAVHNAVSATPGVQISIGVAELSSSDPSPARLLRDADCALYDVKSHTPHYGADPSGQPEATNDTHSDRRRMNAAVHAARRESEEARMLLNRLVEDAPFGFAFVARDMRLVLLNSTLANAFELTAADQLGCTVAEVLPALWPTLEPIYRRVLDEESPVLGVGVRGRPATDPSQTRDWLANHYPIRVDGEVIGIGVIVIDVTHRRHLELAATALTDSVVSALSAAAEVRDPYTAGHQRRVATIAGAIAAELGYDDHTVNGIRIAAAIHDIGKLAVPAEILARPGRLTNPEMEIIRAHGAAGYEILRGIEFPWPVADMVLQHHERLDGSGYPHRLAGDEIIIGARIIAVADVVEAMSAHRPYRAAVGIEAALATIEEGRGRLFDPAVVDACVDLFRNQDLGTRLAQGESTADVLTPALTTFGSGTPKA